MGYVVNILDVSHVFLASLLVKSKLFSCEQK